MRDLQVCHGVVDLSRKEVYLVFISLLARDFSHSHVDLSFFQAPDSHTPSL